MNRLERLRELEAKATPKSWVSNRFYAPDGQEVWTFQTSGRLLGTTIVQANAELIAEARNVLPELLALVERLADVDPYDTNRICVGCNKRRLVGHALDCPFLLLEQWKAEAPLSEAVMDSGLVTYEDNDD